MSREFIAKISYLLIVSHLQMEDGAQHLITQYSCQEIARNRYTVAMVIVMVIAMVTGFVIMENQIAGKL